MTALRSFIHQRAGELEQELADAIARPMNAKHRLQLENVVDRAARDLGAARWLIDLLDEALWSPPIRVVLHELVRETSKTPVSATESVESVAVTLAAPADQAEVLLNPRVGMGLIGIGVAFVASKYSTVVPHIDFRSAPGSFSGLTISSDPGSGEGLMLVRRPLIAPSLACLDAVAGLTGARVNRRENGSSVSLHWPTAARSPAA